MLFKIPDPEEILELKQRSARQFQERYTRIIEKYSKPPKNTGLPIVIDFSKEDTEVTVDNEPETYHILPVTNEISCNFLKRDLCRPGKLDYRPIHVTPASNCWHYSKKNFLDKKNYKAKCKFLKKSGVLSSCSIQLKNKCKPVKSLAKYFINEKQLKPVNPQKNCGNAETPKGLQYSNDYRASNDESKPPTQHDNKKAEHCHNYSPTKKEDEDPIKLPSDKTSLVEPAIYCTAVDEKIGNAFVVLEDCTMNINKSDCEISTCDIISIYSDSTVPSMSSEFVQHSTPNQHLFQEKIDSNDSDYLGCDEVSLLSFGDNDDKDSLLDSTSKLSTQSLTLELFKNRIDDEENKEHRVVNWCKSLRHSFPNSLSPINNDKCPDNASFHPLDDSQYLKKDPPKAYFMDDDEVILISLEDSFESLDDTTVDVREMANMSKCKEILETDTNSVHDSEISSQTSACSVLLHYNSELSSLYKMSNYIFT